MQAEYVQAWSINVDDLMKEALSLDYQYGLQIRDLKTLHNERVALLCAKLAPRNSVGPCLLVLNNTGDLIYYSLNTRGY